MLIPMTLQTNQLNFERNEQTVLQNVNFTLQEGEALQITGANGSGKTTLLRIICGLLAPSSGNVLWNDNPIKHNYSEYLNQLIYLGHQAAVKNDLTVQENLVLFSTLTKTKAKSFCEDVIKQVGLADYQYTLVQTLSAGQKRRLALAKLLSLNAKLWILDEPFIALDQDGVALVESLIAQHLAQQGMVILTSHQAFKLQNINQQKLFLGAP